MYELIQVAERSYLSTLEMVKCSGGQHRPLLFDMVERRWQAKRGI